MATKRIKRRTPAEEAQLRISRWERNDRDFESWGTSDKSFSVDGYALDLTKLGLKNVPDSLRALDTN